MMRFTETQIVKLESDIEYCQNQKTASRFNRETWRAEEKENRIWIILSWRENIFLNEQHINEDKKQEVEQQEHRTIQDCQRHQEIKLWVRLT